VNRSKDLRDVSSLLTIITLCMVIAQTISPLSGAWLVVIEFAVITVLGWALYWKLPIRNNHA
jgi:uncharacterized membrane protein